MSEPCILYFMLIIYWIELKFISATTITTTTLYVSAYNKNCWKKDKGSTIFIMFTLIIA